MVCTLKALIALLIRNGHFAIINLNIVTGIQFLKSSSSLLPLYMCVSLKGSQLFVFHLRSILQDVHD